VGELCPCLTQCGLGRAVVKVGRNGPERHSACSPNSGEEFRLLMLDGNAAERLIIGSFKWVNGSYTLVS